MPQNEEWKTIEENDGYEVSNLGRVRSIQRVVVRSNGTNYSVKSSFKKLRRNQSKNLVVDLFKNNLYNRYQVNHLVAKAFCSWYFDGVLIGFIDGNRNNCASSNLRKLADDEITKLEKIKLSSRKSHLKLRFGITPEIFEDIMRKQDYKCAVCHRHKDEVRGTFHIDHSHVDLRIRGLLCNNCNKYVVSHYEDGALLRRAGEYIESADTGYKAPPPVKRKRKKRA